MTAAASLADLAAWQAAGWLRPLDVALARFLHDTAPTAPPDLLLAAALLSRLESAGHSALPLDDLPGTAAELLDWPAEALNALSQALATRPLQPQAWAGCAAVEADPPDDEGGTPLVLANDRLALRRHWRDEGDIARQLRARAAASLPVDEAQATAWLGRLFPPRADGDVDWQRRAGEVALRGRFTLVTGGPGTGKTWTAARLLVLLQALRGRGGPDGPPAPWLRVGLAAPTGKAAARLKQSIQQALQGLRPALGPLAGEALDPWADALPPARTLHALLGPRPGTRRFRHDATNPLPLDLLIVDEASMVHLALMARLLDALPSTARLVLLGDPDQLASVEAGAVLADLCAAPVLVPRTVALRESRRFQGAIGALAQAMHGGDGAAALAALRGDASGALALQSPRDATAVLPLAVQGYRPMLQALQGPGTPAERARAALQAFEAFRLLCALREGPWGVDGLNGAVERALADAGLLRRSGEWYTGRPVMLSRNQPALGLFNGDIGLVLPADDGTPRAWFAEGEALHAVAVGRLEQVQTAFAMTVHKSQGSEFGHVALVLPPEDGPLLTRELVYTGLTRARERFTLVAPQPALLARAVARRTRREGGLRARLAP
ncbi:exodeoxyribonuclease V subunit alpha [Rubrivivax albus]|uniref:RecBCD enzyme subunit RecD n=1 Tax=Rubrivivax albus TaxID=2499835 RepID=A0A3S2UPJ5_9BURK|nr:exodeoxyribonuclease V subunit alpha [Rubrivivax albus]RVT51007.1 exodeoxyribonuclease V subunit alpha [Rubrivivax albus]